MASKIRDVCYWPKADIGCCTAHVRFRGGKADMRSSWSNDRIRSSGRVSIRGALLIQNSLDHHPSLLTLAIAATIVLLIFAWTFVQ